jgi:hypothetical protein
MAALARVDLHRAKRSLLGRSGGRGGMRRIGIGTVGALSAILFAGAAGAMETRVMVRARTTDAKFIGTSRGGALVTIRRSAGGADSSSPRASDCRNRGAARSAVAMSSMSPFSQ